MGICYIVGAGDFADAPAPVCGDFLIAADGGALHLARAGLCPDLFVGDFDSLPAGFVPSCPVLRFPAEKDDTDTALAVAEGRRRGYREFCIYGALGGARLDHTVANLVALAGYARAGLTVTLIGRGQRARALFCGTLRFPADFSGMVSVFALGGDAHGVTLRGLQYPLSDATLHGDVPLGVSNHFLAGEEAVVSVRDGCLLVIYEGNGEIREEKTECIGQ